jgi:hypothetical protein
MRLRIAEEGTLKRIAGARFENCNVAAGAAEFDVAQEARHLQ